VVRAVLVSALVLAAGGLIGAGGSLLEQSRATWRPQAVRTETGWKISPTGVATSHSMAPHGLALHGHALAWVQGRNTLLMDLRSGKIILLHAAPRGTDSQPPGVSDRYVVWGESDPASQLTVVWVYDLARHRRYRLAGIDGQTSPPVISGRTVVWRTASLASREASEIQAVDLETGTPSLLARGRDLGPPAAGDGYAAWWSGADSGAPRLVVKDLGSGGETTVAQPLGRSSVSVTQTFVSGSTLVWAVVDDGAATSVVQSYDVATDGRRSVVRPGAASRPTVFEGRLVWAERDEGRQGELMAWDTVSGEPYALLGGAGGEAVVHGDTIAWLVSQGDGTVVAIETMTVSR
jgi:hypothetical protein